MSIAPSMTPSEVGSYYLDKHGNVWQLVSYSDRPTATLERVGKPGDRRHGVVGAPIFDDFTRLVPQERS